MAPSLPTTSGDTSSEKKEGAVSDAADSKKIVQMLKDPINADLPANEKANDLEDDASDQIERQARLHANGSHDSADGSVADVRENSSDIYHDHESVTSPEIHAAEHPAQVDQRKQEVGREVAITAENAQSIFSPDACIFVANLDRSRTRIELVDEITRIFQQIGECWVKVRHDGKTNIPVSFVQFRNVEFADIAARTMQGTNILGRPCRIERARAERTLFCYRKDMQPVTTPMILNQLRAFGDVEHFWYPSYPEKAMYNLPDGIYVRFQLFQPCQEALKSLRNDPSHIFKLQDTKPREMAAPVILADIKLDQIFVGDLSYYIDACELRVIFEAYGRVEEVYIKREPIKGYAWAYVKFNNPWSAACAVQWPFPLTIGHRIARIEPRRIKGHQPGFQGPGRFYSGYPLHGRIGPLRTTDVREYTWNSRPTHFPRQW